MPATHDTLTFRCPGKYVSQVQGEEAVVEVVAVVAGEGEGVMAMTAMVEVSKISDLLSNTIDNSHVIRHAKASKLVLKI